MTSGGGVQGSRESGYPSTDDRDTRHAWNDG